MKLLRLFSKTKKAHIVREVSHGTLSIEDYGRDQLKKLAEKGLSFQIVVL